MNKPRKAYLVEESHTGFGFRVSPVIVLHVEGRLATVALLNVTPGKAWIPTLGAQWPCRVENLASSRAKALAKIAFRLRDLDESLTLAFAQAADAAAAQPAAPVTTRIESPARHPTSGGPRRRHVPWWQNQD